MEAEIPIIVPPAAPDQRVTPVLPPAAPDQRVTPVLPPTAPDQRVTPVLPPTAPDQRVAPVLPPTAPKEPAPLLRTRRTSRRRPPVNQVTTLIFDKAPHDHHLLPFPTLSSIQQSLPTPIIPIATAATPSERQKYLPIAEPTPPSNLANDVLPSYRLLRQGPNGQKWEKAHDTAIYKLVDTGTMTFIPYNHQHKFCYFKAVCKEKLDSEGLRYQHVRGTAADTRSDYEGPTAATTAGLSTVKILLNSVVSTPGAKFCTADLKDYYLGTPMDKPVYMVISVKQRTSHGANQQRHVRPHPSRAPCSTTPRTSPTEARLRRMP